MADILYLVIPCYNEQEVLPETAKQLREKMMALIESEKISEKSRIVFVNDGSKDNTWEMIASLHHADPLFQGICLSRNRGHQNALLAGLMTVREQADVTVSLDADLQDDINAIDEMLEKYYGGCDIVYGVRSARDTDTAFKKGTAQGFYRFMKWLGVEMQYNHADFRLMSKRSLAALADFKEVNLFLRGLVPMLGFKTDNVYYERRERMAGESKYPFKKMVAFAFEGITSLSIKPIRFITALGFIMFFISMAFIIYFFVRFLVGATVSGWVTIVMSVWILGALQLIAIGVIGEYIGKIYLEAKGRPRYIVETYLGDHAPAAEE